MKKMLCYPAMRDGTKLVTWVTLPGDGTGKYPAILSRNPYAAAPEPGTPAVQENLPDGGAEAHGFASVANHCRGRGGSEGDFLPFYREKEDGLDVIAWIEEQPWFDGRLYFSGGSYLGYVQLAMYDSLPPCVKGASTAVMANDGRFTFFQNGVFKADVGPIWFPGMYHYGDLIHHDAHTSFEREWEKLPMGEYAKRIYGYDVPCFSGIWKMKDDPMAMPEYFTQAIDSMKKLNIPILMVTGWAEPFFNGTWRMWDEIPAGIREKCAFLVGPWSHGCSVLEGWNYPFTDAGTPPACELAWLLHLRDGTPLDEKIKEGCINYYHVGKGVWEHAETWPLEPADTPLYLCGDGTLRESVPERGSVTYRFDPADPVRYPGGPHAFGHDPQGFADQPAPDFRPDVKSFLTAPLTEELTLSGRIKATLEVSTTAPATMFLIRVSCVQTNGTTTPIQDYPAVFTPAAPGERAAVPFETDPVCWTLHPGEKLRLDVTSSDAHSYRVHTNTRDDWMTAAHAYPCDNTVYFGESKLLLPVRHG